MRRMIRTATLLGQRWGTAKPSLNSTFLTPGLPRAWSRCCASRPLETVYPTHVSSVLLQSRPLLQRFHATSVCCLATFTAADIEADLGVLVEGEPGMNGAALEALTAELYEDAKAAVAHAAAVYIGDEARDTAPGPLELSLVLCDDPYIQGLNREWRGKDAPTDVLSFELGDEEDERVTYKNSDWEEEEEGEAGGGEDAEEGDVVVDFCGSKPATLLGDVVISLDTAERQAAERGHSLRDECRILLVHGVLHLLGYDHENGGEEEVEMAAAEAKIMQRLNWKGQGLIAAAVAAVDEGERDAQALHEKKRHFTSKTSTSATVSAPKHHRFAPAIRILALDMDGTLLDSTSNVLPRSVAAIRAAMDLGVKVMLATGKARPAAQAAMEKAGLAGAVVGPAHPGIFLQGLSVHGMCGTVIAQGKLPPDVVRAAFQYAADTGAAIIGFTGEGCVTIRMTPEVKELNTRYYEPLAQVLPSVEAVVQGLPLSKLLFMAPAALVATEIQPHWESVLLEADAQTMQAVPTMLELVPRGWNKWVGMEKLLASTRGAFHREQVMAIGDGGNDLELVIGAGIGVAMCNAVPAVKEAADAVVASNDDDGIAEAIERFIL